MISCGLRTRWLSMSWNRNWSLPNDFFDIVISIRIVWDDFNIQSIVLLLAMCDVLYLYFIGVKVSYWEGLVHVSLVFVIYSYWLIIYGFTSRSRIFHLYGYVTITSEGLQNLGLRLALRPFELGGVFIVSNLLWHVDFVFPVSSEGPPHPLAYYNAHGDLEGLFYPGSSRVPIQWPLTTHNGMWRTYSYLEIPLDSQVRVSFP
jgi:hypothetical protein